MLVTHTSIVSTQITARYYSTSCDPQ